MYIGCTAGLRWVYGKAQGSPGDFGEARGSPGDSEEARGSPGKPGEARGSPGKPGEARGSPGKQIPRVAWTRMRDAQGQLTTPGCHIIL